MKGLVIGGGSAGKNYLLAGVKLGHSMYLCERESKKSADLKQEIQELTLVDQLENLESVFDYIVVATTADSHLENAIMAVALSPKYLIVEKLLTNSLSELDTLVSLQASNPKVQFRSHNRWKLLGVTSGISRLNERFDLGELISFSSIGGAMCLASGGVHWLASLNELFTLDQKEFEISGNLKFSIQKNRPKFDTAIGEIQVLIGGKRIRFEYSELSRVTPMQLLLFEEGHVSLNFSGEYQVFRNDLPKLGSSKKYDLATMCDQGNLIPGSINSFESLLDSLSGDCPDPLDFQGSVRANEIIILAMQLSHKRKLTQQDLQSTRLDLNSYTKSWRVT
ncbi:Gfo/Idh/MocA family oxidoreductase [Candidatus Planktophila lacus]|uniref:Dehydrogenase n=1 Tax=Candidatus Planktophila lacus TaxID=1884913 RepID=A0AAC9YQY6_9ACTN|nr:Gfo/Idh/MocA family oxidoreductase [Candidatus Planktophila lacus]ASY10019.1 dehydrogenase [Candidatus Planktophila lacus]